MRYPARFTPEDVGFVVTFRDIPEAITQGDNEIDARFMATDVLREAIIVYLEENRYIPPPSLPLPGEYLIDVPEHVAAKVQLLNNSIGVKVLQS